MRQPTRATWRQGRSLASAVQRRGQTNPRTPEDRRQEGEARPAPGGALRQNGNVQQGQARGKAARREQKQGGAGQRAGKPRYNGGSVIDRKCSEQRGVAAGLAAARGRANYAGRAETAAGGARVAEGRGPSGTVQSRGFDARGWGRGVKPPKKKGVVAAWIRGTRA